MRKYEKQGNELPAMCSQPFFTIDHHLDEYWCSMPSFTMEKPGNQVPLMAGGSPKNTYQDLPGPRGNDETETVLGVL